MNPAETLRGVTLKVNYGGAEAYILFGDDADGRLAHVAVRASSRVGTGPEQELSRLGREVTQAIADGVTLTAITEQLDAAPAIRPALVAFSVPKSSPFAAIEAAGSWDALLAAAIRARYLGARPAPVVPVVPPAEPVTPEAFAAVLRGAALQLADSYGIRARDSARVALDAAQKAGGWQGAREDANVQPSASGGPCGRCAADAPCEGCGGKADG